MIRFRNLKRNLHVLHNNTQNVYITFHCMLGGYKVLDVFSILDFPPLPSSAGTGTGQIYRCCGPGELQDPGLQSGVLPQDPNEEVETSPLCLVPFPHLKNSLGMRLYVHAYCKQLVSVLGVRGLSFVVCSIKFFDEMSKVESSVDAEDEEEEELPQPAAITVKVLQLSGLTIELGSTDLSSARIDLEENFSGEEGR